MNNIITKNKIFSQFKVKKTTSLTTFWCIYGWRRSPFSSVSIVDFEKVNVTCRAIMKILKQKILMTTENLKKV